MVLRERVEARGPARGEINAAALTDAGRAAGCLVVGDRAAGDGECCRCAGVRREDGNSVVKNATPEAVGASAPSSANGLVAGERAAGDGERSTKDAGKPA